MAFVTHGGRNRPCQAEVGRFLYTETEHARLPDAPLWAVDDKAWSADRLREHVWESRHVVFFVGRDGKATGVDRFRHRMAEAYKAAGLEGVTTHGLRYTAATRLRELGQDWTEIEAITGHATVEMVKKYAGRRRKAALSIHRLNQATRHRSVKRGVNRAGGDGAK